MKTAMCVIKCPIGLQICFRHIRALQEEAKLDVAKNKIQKTSLGHVITKKKPLFERTGSIINNEKASCSKTNEFQHQFTEIAQIEYNDTSSDKSSPEPNDDGQINTPGIADNLNETSEENIESLELSDENEVDIGALHTFFPVTGKYIFCKFFYKHRIHFR